MKFSKGDLFFLAYFLPIFFLKTINKVADDFLLIVITLFCLAVFTILFVIKRLNKGMFCLFALLVLYASLLMLTCGKQGAFLSVVTVIALKDVSSYKKIYKICFWVGFVALLIFMYRERTSYTTIRYMNGAWIEMTKRTNILYISFIAVVALFMLQKSKINWINICIITILGYAMYLYTGSRTGLLSFTVLLFVFILTKVKTICKLKIFKWGCIFSPAVCILIAIFSNYFYGKIPILNVLDAYMQGRLIQGKKYFDTYSLKLFGQRIFESTDTSNYWILDCAYLDMLICYGVLFAFLWTISSIAVIRWLYLKERYTEVAIMVMYAVYGISETFLPNCFLNVSIFLYAEWIYSKFQTEEKNKFIIHQNIGAMKGNLHV